MTCIEGVKIWNKYAWFRCIGSCMDLKSEINKAGWDYVPRNFGLLSLHRLHAVKFRCYDVKEHTKLHLWAHFWNILSYDQEYRAVTTFHLFFSSQSRSEQLIRLLRRGRKRVRNVPELVQLGRQKLYRLMILIWRAYTAILSILAHVVCP